MSSQKRVGVVMGGSSREREVSLRSGRAVSDGLTRLGCEVVPIVLQEGSDMFFTLMHADIDVAFLALHGRLGEDGCVQGLLELLGIPYTGSSVLSSALAMDKLKAKELFRLHNVPTPPYYVLDESEIEDLDDVHGSFGYPVMVKPRREGSSLGASRANSPSELRDAALDALSYDCSILVERFVTGKEIAVGLLDGRVLGAIEIAPRSGIYDYQAKYTPGFTDYFMPARLPPTRYGGILNLAERAASALETRGAVRVDLLVTEGQNEYVLEVNTLPGMTEQSLLPKIAAGAGFDFDALCAAMLDRARLYTGVPRSDRSAHASYTESDGEVLETHPARRRTAARARSA
jgi:D-alanine-D-alanine ligase